MFSNRIPEEVLAVTNRMAPPTPWFLMIPVASTSCQIQSPLQSLYQQMYEQAVASAQKPSMRDLFAIMN